MTTEAKKRKMINEIMEMLGTMYSPTSGLRQQMTESFVKKLSYNDISQLWSIVLGSDAARGLKKEAK